MKASKLFLAGVFSLGIASFVSARDNDGGFGLKGGVGFSTISFGDPKQDGVSLDDSKNTWKVGGLLGVSYEARIGNSFAIDVEALLANKGVKQTSDYKLLGKNGNITLKTNLITLDIPVSAKFYLGDNFNIYLGPYFSYILGANLKATQTFDGKTQSKESDNWFSDDFKDANGNYALNRIDFGANAGLEFVSDGGFGIGARFQKGFLDLTNNDYKGVLVSDKKFVTNTGVQVYAIVRF